MTRAKKCVEDLKDYYNISLFYYHLCNTLCGEMDNINTPLSEENIGEVITVDTLLILLTSFWTPFYPPRMLAS